MLYTVGYSSFFEEDKLIERLKEQNVSKLYDIRTFPYSNAFPQYNEPNIKPKLKKEGIEYTFLGDYVGGLIIKKEVKKGINSLRDLTRNPKIKKGLNFLYKKAKEENVVIMCAEKSPLDCHRFLAVGSILHFYTDLKVKNILDEKVLTAEHTIEDWKQENNLSNLNLEPEKLIFERLFHLYKNLNKREEKFPDKSKLKNLSLF